MGAVSGVGGRLRCEFDLGPIALNRRRALDRARCQRGLPVEACGPAKVGLSRFDQRLAQRREDPCQGNRATVFRPRLAVHANEESA